MENKPKQYPFVFKILFDKRRDVEAELNHWNELKNHTDTMIARQANGNIPSCIHRLEELKQVLLILVDQK